MSDIYAKNIEVMKRRWPEYVGEINAYDKGASKYTCGTEIIDDRKILYVDKGNQIFQLDSMYSENLVLDRWYEFVKNDYYDKVTVIFGLGNGMYVRRLLKENKKSGCDMKIIVYEPGIDILSFVINEFDISDVLGDNSVILYVSSKNEELFSKSLKKCVTDCNYVGTVATAYINYPKLFPTEYKEFNNIINDTIVTLSGNRLLDENRGENFYINTINNIKRFINSYSLDSLRDAIPANIPAIIVASGPSLSKNIDDLKLAKNRAFIIAVDSSIELLLRNGIIPDMYISVDSIKEFQYFDVDNLGQVPMIGEMTSPEHVYKDNQIQFMTCVYNSHIKQILSRIKPGYYNWELRSGGSVANSAFIFLQQLGFQTIIMVGQDLAYTNDKAHAEGIIYEHDNMKNNIIMTEDVYGNPIRTSEEFTAYRMWYEEQIQANPHLRVINSTEGGANIKGTESMSLIQAIDTVCVNDVDMSSVFSKCKPLFDENEKEQFICQMKELSNVMTEIINEAMHINRLISNKSVDINELMNRVNNLNDEISMNYIYYLNAKSRHEMVDSINKNTDTNKDEVLSVYCDSVIKAADRIKRDLENMRW